MNSTKGPLSTTPEMDTDTETSLLFLQYYLALANGTTEGRSSAYWQHAGAELRKLHESGRLPRECFLAERVQNGKDCYGVGIMEDDILRTTLEELAPFLIRR